MENIKTIKCKGVIWYKAKDVTNALGYCNKSKAITDHVNDSDKNKYENLTTKKRYNMAPHTIFINENGLKSLIIKSRMINANEFAKTLGIDVLNHKYESKEIESIVAITKVFNGEKMRTQFPVLSYRVDLYFPDYNLCIECDENGHGGYNIENEQKRHDEITKKLKCKWVRFNPDDKDFNIFTVINQIFIIIKTNI